MQNIKWVNYLLNLFYPSICISCEKHLTEQEELLCLYCERHLPQTHFARYDKNPIERLFWGRTKVQSAASIFFFRKGEGIQKMMHLLKYKRRKDVGLWMGKKLGLELLSSKRFNEIDYIVPVPLHPKKEFKRGYNQSELIAKGMESMSKWTVASLLKRKDNTTSQTRKGKYERWLNVGSSFYADPRFQLKGKNVLIVDDVITTGATLEGCIIALLEGGANSVSVATFASA
jgi:ComF family protein